MIDRYIQVILITISHRKPVHNPMYSLIFLGSVSLALSLVLTPLIRDLAWRYGIVDHPDQRRKVHNSPTPCIGGVAIFLAVLGAFGLLLLVRLSSGQIVLDGLPLILRLLPALAIVFGIGLLDDLISVRPWIRLTAEAVAGGLAWIGGIHIGAMGGYSFSGSVTGFIVTVVWIVTCTNAINLIDGVDGLAVGVGMLAAITMLIAAILDHNFPMALAIVPLAGALLGFLRFNFVPASIFLGDSGSLTIGFLLGCSGALWAEKSATLLGMTAPLMVLAVPLMDVGLAVARRLVRGQPLFSADNSHIHHKLLSRGLSPRHLLYVVYVICAIGSITAILLTISHNENRDFVLVLVCLAAWLGLQHLGYSEFSIAKKVVLGGTIRSALSAELALEVFEETITPDTTIAEIWDILGQTCPQFGFAGIVFHIDGIKREWGIRAGWQARIDFPDHGYIIVWREFGAINHGAAAVLFIDCVSRLLNQKLSMLSLVKNA